MACETPPTSPSPEDSSGCHHQKAGRPKDEGRGIDKENKTNKKKNEFDDIFCMLSREKPLLKKHCIYMLQRTSDLFGRQRSTRVVYKSETTSQVLILTDF